MQDVLSVTGVEQAFELAVLDFARAIFVYIFDQFLDIDCHFELVLNNIDKQFGIDYAFAASLPAQGNEGVEGVLLVIHELILLLVSNNFLECFVVYNTISLGCHPVDLLVRDLLPHHFHELFQLAGVYDLLVQWLLVILHQYLERLLTFFFFFLSQRLITSIELTFIISHT